jgi:LmbE family N-acetylglucosaminyl deacetylase
VTDEGAPPRLGDVVVLSTHLDDGVLSLGGWMRRITMRGSRISLVTVLAGDPDDLTPASSWDRRSGFRTAGEAARVRRAEDRRACAVLGLSPVWLPFGDALRGREATDDDVWSAIRPLLVSTDAVLLPGSPLSHPDHRWLADLVLGRRDELPPCAIYAEQPYRYHDGGPLRTPHALAGGSWDLRWDEITLMIQERWAKFRGVRAYRSQVPLLGARPLLAARLAWARGDMAEAIAWVS